MSLLRYPIMAWILAFCVATTSAFTPIVGGSESYRTITSTSITTNSHLSMAPNDNNTNMELSGRRTFFHTAAIFLATTAAATTQASPAWAAEEKPLPTRQVVTDTFASIRYELNDPHGGVAIMQSRIDEQDWAGLLEFTQGYDLELRKKRMKQAKKLLNGEQAKALNEKATQYANAVTFDLIGINRNSRSGQESVEGANKYLQELRDDVQTFLELESTVVVADP